MTPAEQQLLDTLAKEGVNMAPYLKYAALAVGLWYVFVGLVAAAIAVTVIYQFWKMSRDFNG